MNSEYLRIFMAFVLFTIPAQTGKASLETKVIHLDSSNKLIAIDKGSEEGLQPNTYFYIYRNNQFIGELSIFKTSRQVAICEVKNLTRDTEIRVNDRIFLLTEQERAAIEAVKKPYLTETPSAETDLKSKAQKIADEEAVKRKLDEILIKEKAKGIAEVVKTEKELARMKEEAEAIVKEVIEEKKKAKRIISFDFRDADIRHIVNGIGREADVNIVMPPDLPSLPITISLKDVEMESALDVILRMADYTFLKEDNIYKIVKVGVAEKKTSHKTFSPRYIQAEKLKTLITDGGLLSSEGKSIVDTRSNKLVVIDVPTNLAKVEEVVKQVDVRPRQVTIEAKIIDVYLTDTEKLGIEWTWVKPRAGASTDDSLSWGFTVDAVTDEGKGFFKYGTLSAVEIATVLEALMKREHANILSKPTITTLNNEEAKINVTRKLAYRSDTATTVDGTITTAIKWEEKEVGIILSVTPFINEAGDIIMKVEPTASMLQEWTSTDPNTRYPIIMSRSATTQVIIKDGDTLVIGGLITQELRDTRSGIPILSDIPILGIPFQKRSQSLVNTELLIFITPHIVPSKNEEQPKG